MNPIVSLVVVSYNCKPWFERFFSSVQAQTIFDRCEIIVVDNSSTDGSVEICQQAMAGWPNGRVLPTGGNYGYGGGCNIGAAVAQGKYLFFLNPDVWFEPDCLEALVRHAEASSAKVFSAIELGYDGADLMPGSHGQGAPGFDVFGCTTPPSPKENLHELFAIGSFYFIRSDLFKKLGGFDEQFFMYGEEMDLSWRARIAGEAIELVYAARVHHAASGCTDQRARTTESRRFYANRNQILTILKNAHGPLLLLAFSHVALITVEAVAGAWLARKRSFIRSSLVEPVADCWRLRQHIFSQRRLIRSYRQRGDWWITRRFFRFQFGHWGDIKRFLGGGVVIDSGKKPVIVTAKPNMPGRA
ncbi:MAG TPA: glycosyltransferase family 2 protein [Verrucomicrobiae bacterium]|nr:glycosyltransferase family 2 protein [Verrucomicrobiae bacterium]